MPTSAGYAVAAGDELGPSDIELDGPLCDADRDELAAWVVQRVRYGRDFFVRYGEFAEAEADALQMAIMRRLETADLTPQFEAHCYTRPVRPLNAVEAYGRRPPRLEAAGGSFRYSAT